MRVLCFVALLISLYCPVASNSWHGITPLVSKRTDVEKLLGLPTADSKAADAAEYKTRTERVFILYSTGPCSAQPSNGWNVPAGTVIEISVEPIPKTRISDLKLDAARFAKIRDPEVLFLTYYTSEEQGLSIEVNTDDGLVNKFRYLPWYKNYNLRL